MLSVIVLNWNGKQHLKVCLESLLSQSYNDFETILVDNGSTDDSVAYVRQNFPQVKVLALPENVGFAAGNNAGIRVAQGDLIALLNNDTEAHPDWLSNLVTALEVHPDIGFCASTMLDFERRALIDSAGLGYSRHGIAYRQTHGETFSRANMPPAPTFAACGGAMVMRKAVIDVIGLLDEDFYMYNEDVDWCFRAQLLGRGGWYVSEAIVYHKQSASTRVARPAERWFRMRTRNQWWVFMKNMPTPLLMRSLPHAWYGLLRVAAANAKTGTLRAYLAGLGDAYRAWPRVRHKRREIQALRQIDWRELARGINSHYPYASLTCKLQNSLLKVENK